MHYKLNKCTEVVIEVKKSRKTIIKYHDEDLHLLINKWEEDKEKEKERQKNWFKPTKLTDLIRHPKEGRFGGHRHTWIRFVLYATEETANVMVRFHHLKSVKIARKKRKKKEINFSSSSSSSYFSSLYPPAMMFLKIIFLAHLNSKKWKKQNVYSLPLQLLLLSFVKHHHKMDTYLKKNRSYLAMSILPQTLKTLIITTSRTHQRCVLNSQNHNQCKRKSFFIFWFNLSKKDEKSLLIDQKCRYWQV